DVGGDEAVSLAQEQLLAERLLEALDLRADGGGREPKLLRRVRDGAGPRDGPEVEQVVVVEPRAGSHGSEVSSGASSSRQQKEASRQQKGPGRQREKAGGPLPGPARPSSPELDTCDG